MTFKPLKDLKMDFSMENPLILFSIFSLTLVFLCLKLINYVTWSWFWILSPILIPILMFTSLAIIFALDLIIEQIIFRWNK